MRAFLKNYRQSPRKVRLLTDLIRNKDVSLALRLLAVAPKRAALPVKKLLHSAITNAKQRGNFAEENLFVKEVRVDEGPTLKRMRPRARGSAYLIRKRTSHIMLALGERQRNKKVSNKDKKLKTTKTLNPKP